MKKFVKLSLAAAVATAGLTTTASAVSLEEAIKGVDVSGQFRYRANELKTDGGASNTDSDVEVEVGVKVPVNDMVTAVFKIDFAGNKSDVQSSTATTTSETAKDTLAIEDYYFAYNNGAVTAQIGQQNIPGRMTDGNQGDGAVVLYNTSAGITLGAAAFMNHNAAGKDAVGTTATNGANLLSVMAMGNVGPVAVHAQYADVSNVLDAYNLKADLNVEGIKLGAEYTALSSDLAGDTNKDYATTKVYAAASIEKLSLKATYATTDKDGGGSIDNYAGNDSTETPSEFLLWNIGTADRLDAEITAIDASYPLTDKVTLRAAYATGEEGIAGTDLEETLGQVTYKMSKNLSTYFRYATFEAAGVEKNRGRIEVAYKF